jgi:hypothetical protein
MNNIEAENPDVELEKLFQKAKDHDVYEKLFKFFNRVISFYKFSCKSFFLKKDHAFTISENELCDEISVCIDEMIKEKDKETLEIFEIFNNVSEQLMIVSLIVSYYRQTK